MKVTELKEVIDKMIKEGKGDTYVGVRGLGRIDPKTYATSEWKKHLLLDKLRTHFGVRSDSKLSIRLGCSASELSKVRRRNSGLGSDLLLCIHEETGWPIAEIRKLQEESLNEI